MRRRDFIAGVGAAALPVAAKAQQRGRMRRVGAFLEGPEGDQLAQQGRNAFVQGLEKTGWIDGRNVRIEYRVGTGDIERLRMLAKELVELRPDVLFAAATPELAALQQATRSVPIVFALVGEPVAGGFVASLARPGGNITGFASTEASVVGKRLEMLKEAAPEIRRIAFLYNPDTAPYVEGQQFRYAETAAAAYGVELIAAPVRSDHEIAVALATLGREPNGGILVAGDEFTYVHREEIYDLIVHHRLPAIYAAIPMVEDGGLMAYTNDFLDDYRRAAGYIDRILRGEKPGDLPVQVPVKYRLVVNLKAAKAIGLTIPETFLVRADRVIE